MNEPLRRIVFLCVENSCRSQIAEAFARQIAKPGVQIHSAGSQPSGRVHPTAQALMQEIGLDLSTQRSKGLDALPAGALDVAVTMGCGDTCPALRARRREDWNIPDPKNMPLEQGRAVRDRIKAQVQELMAAL